MAKTRKLNLNRTTTVSVSIELPETLPEGGIPMGTMSGDEAREELAIASTNSGEVIAETISIEESLDEIVKVKLFGVSYPATVESNFFVQKILKSSMLQFSAKKSLVLDIANETGVLSGSEYSELQRSIKRVMDYRNAFAHGKMHFNATEGYVQLSFFQNEPRSVLLNDEYWCQLESDYRSCRGLVDRVSDELNRIWLKEIEARFSEGMDPS